MSRQTPHPREVVVGGEKFALSGETEPCGGCGYETDMLLLDAPVRFDERGDVAGSDDDYPLLCRACYGLGWEPVGFLGAVAEDSC